MRNVGRQLREQARLPAVNARGRLVSGLITMVMALAGFVTAGALPAAAAPGTVQYVALGDLTPTRQESPVSSAAARALA